MIEALRRFHKDHPDALLVYNWNCPYARREDEYADVLFRTVCDSSFISSGDKCVTLSVAQTMSTGKIMAAEFPLGEWLENEGISLDDSFEIERTQNPSQLAELYRRVDAAVFPYAFRCANRFPCFRIRLTVSVCTTAQALRNRCVSWVPASP